MSLSIHIPGRPKTAEPYQLVELARRIHNPNVLRSGVTTTEDGNWALLLIVKPYTKTPIQEIEQNSLGFPTIYLDDNNRQVWAKPAYPFEAIK